MRSYKEEYLNLKNHYPTGITPHESISLNKKVWKDDYQHRVGLNMESQSGYGSSIGYIKNLIDLFPSLLKKYNVNSILDLPCGDFHVMSQFDWPEVNYIGGDLVEEQIDYNKNKYQNRDFRVINMITDDLPKSDLVFTRDCLIHLSYMNIISFLEKLCKSNSKYFMASTSPLISENQELGGIIGFRSLNLEKYPFNFPNPLEIIQEESPKMDKCMGLWLVEDIKKNI